MKLLVIASTDNGYEISIRDQTNTGTIMTLKTEVYLDPEEVEKKVLDYLNTTIKNDIKKPYKNKEIKLDGCPTTSISTNS